MSRMSTFGQRLCFEEHPSSPITDLSLHGHPGIDTLFDIDLSPEGALKDIPRRSSSLIFSSQSSIDLITNFIEKSCSIYDIVFYVSDGRNLGVIKATNFVILHDTYNLNKYSRLMIYGGRSSTKLLETMIFAKEHKCKLLFYLIPPFM
jgi:hypothetical protein